MLLAEKSHAIQYLPRSGTGRLEPTLEIGILLLEPVHPFWIYSRAAGCGIDSLDACFGRESATPERRELISKMSNELVELLKRFDVRTFAV